MGVEWVHRFYVHMYLGLTASKNLLPNWTASYVNNCNNRIHIHYPNKQHVCLRPYPLRYTTISGIRNIEEA
jgi:hypothetical protein